LVFTVETPPGLRFSSGVHWSGSLHIACPVCGTSSVSREDLRPTTGLGGWTGLGMDLTAGAGRGSMGTWQTVPACWGLG